MYIEWLCDVHCVSKLSFASAVTLYGGAKEDHHGHPVGLVCLRGCVVKRAPTARPRTELPCTSSTAWRSLADALLAEATTQGSRPLLHAAHGLRLMDADAPVECRLVALHTASAALGRVVDDALVYNNGLTADAAHHLARTLARLAPLLSLFAHVLQGAHDEEHPAPPSPTFREQSAWPLLRETALADRRRPEARAVDALADWTVPQGATPTAGLVADLAFVVSVHLPCQGRPHG